MMEKRTRKKRRTGPGFTIGKNDPLFRIFEKHLYEFNYESRDSFISTVVREYVQHLARDRKVVIPVSRRSLLENTIADDVSDMLVRKIYGCLEVEEDKSETGAKSKRPARSADEAAIAAENEAAVLSPQELKKRISKLIR